MFSYVVRATFADPAVAREWLEWMRSAHAADVVAAGALAAQVVALDPPAAPDPDAAPAAARTFEARYRFASRAAFAAYERDHAPRLRAEGLALFPPSRGVRYERSTGEVLLALTAASRPD